ncbi:sensor histidine kinase [Occultella aeris]|uniref:histidine kinase n=1 Tax=Occultella aeris TaxID=2761496 RepID=A0A7M4DPF2_9MICO|nr:histidine kinase [Occultella aeris]VZO39338.1 Sensor histidine kinase DesK [Occultella aeris]
MPPAQSTTPTWRRLAARLSPAAGRSTGDLVADSALFVVALASWGYNGIPGVHPQIEGWWWPVDWVLGAVACVLLWWTRRFPLVVGAIMIIPGALAITAGFPVLASVYRMGLFGRRWPALALTGAHIATALPYHAVVPIPGLPWAVWIIMIPLLYLLCLCLGLLRRSRREVIAGLRENVDRERERYEERLANARRDERERIAREMHDVLAHRLSLLSVHAGALEYRATSPTPPDLAEIRAATGIIRSNAAAAVEDLRELLGLLRSDDALTTAVPQPHLADLEQLITEATAVGQQVDYVSDARPAAIRDSSQRTLYRIVQEALTNARKHAPHAPVTVRIRQTDRTVEVTVANAVPPGVTGLDLPPPGNGLTGLDERVRIDDGCFEANIEDGTFRLWAQLPLEAR